MHSQDPRGFSSGVETAYTNVLNWLRGEPHASGFDNETENDDIDADSPFDNARHFYRLFQLHFVKVQYALLAAIDNNENGNQMPWLEEPSPCVIDIGAGCGAATFAMLDLLCEYNAYAWRNGIPRHAVNVQLVTIDPAKYTTPIFERFLEELKPYLVTHGINVRWQHYREKFPSPICTDHLKQYFRTTHNSSFLVLSSNVIRPQLQWLTAVIDTLEPLLQTLGWTGYIPNELIAQQYFSALNEVFKHCKAQRVQIVDIATNNKWHGQTLGNTLRTVIANVQNQFVKSGEYQWHYSITNTSVHFKNVADSEYGRKGLPGRTSFTFAIQKGINHSFIIDQPWVSALDLQNLELAWARARNYVLYCDFVDEIEVLLADWQIKLYLERLRNHLIANQASCILGIDQAQPFFAPKNDEVDRPKYLLRFGEQILAAAISQICLSEFTTNRSKRILGNQINSQANEYFYEPWLKHFKAYEKAVRQAAKEDRILCKLDLKSYYTNIQQNKLFHKLRSVIETPCNSTVYEALKSLIVRSLTHPHKPCYGVPQSGIAAGLWTSIYLDDIDKEIIASLNGQAEYFRYADDMTIIGNPVSIDQHIKVAETAADKLSLTFNKEKEHRVSAITYQSRFNEDKQITALSRRFRNPLRVLYWIPPFYWKELAYHPSNFLCVYSELLESIGIYLEPNWLHRKIIQNRRYLNGLFYSIFSSNKKYPPYPTNINTDVKTQWCHEFLSLNPVWIVDKSELIADLVTLFNENYYRYCDKNADDNVLSLARKALRFSSNRLSVLGVAPISKELHDLFKCKPWVLSKKTLKALVQCGQEDIVENLGCEWHLRNLPIGHDISGNTVNLLSGPLLCASACWALGFSNKPVLVSNFLKQVLFSTNSDDIERISASEALLRLHIQCAENYDDIARLANCTSSSPYLQKNLILMLAASGVTEWTSLVDTIIHTTKHQIVIDVAQYALVHGGSIFDVTEPAVIRHYYARYYSDIQVDSFIDDYGSLL
jgi:hypothetical protein